MEQPLWKTTWQFLKNVNIELSYDLEILLLGTHPKISKQRLQHTLVYQCYCSLIHNSQNVEIIQISINRKWNFLKTEWDC